MRVLQTTSLSPESLLRILEVTRKLAAPFELKDVLTEIGEAARTVLNAERATVWLNDPATDDLVLIGGGGEAPVRAARDRGILGLSARQRRIVNVPDCRVEPLFDGSVDLDYDNDVRNLLSVPLVEHGALVGVLQVVDRDGGPFTVEDERIAETLAAQCVVFIQRERIARSIVMAEKLDREIKLAREIQMSTLPAEMPRVAGYEMAGRFCPADQTGGDTFDLVRLDDHRLFVLLGDASGHGIGPALSATQMTGMLRVALRLGADLDAIFTHVNNQLVEDLPEEHFVTAFLGILDASRHEVRFHSAGQGPLLQFVAADGECVWHDPTTFPMGFMRYPSLDPPRSLSLAPGDLLGLISDGVFETENAAGEQFGTAGVEDVVVRHRHRPLTELLAALLEELRTFAGGVPQGDDVTIVLVRRREEEPAATTFERYFGRSFDSLEQIFRFVEEFFRAQAIDPALLEPVNFIVEELFTNMVKYNPGNTHDIALSLGRSADALTVRLTDFDVDPFDVTRGPPVDIEKPLAERQIGGLGLHLVRKMADTLRYEFVDRRSTITFTKTLG